MKLTSMKVERNEGDYCESYNNPYGYGLRLCLNDAQCEALGITKPLPAGTIVNIQARAIIQSVTESVEGGEKGNDVRLDIQITDMALEPAGTATDAAEVLFGKSTTGV